MSDLVDTRAMSVSEQCRRPHSTRLNADVLGSSHWRSSHVSINLAPINVGFCSRQREIASVRPTSTATGSHATMSICHGNGSAEQMGQETGRGVWNHLNVETSSASQWTTSVNQTPRRVAGALFCISKSYHI